MTPNISSTFISEAETCISGIRSGALYFFREGGNIFALKEPLKMLRDLQKGASASGSADIEAKASLLAEKFVAIMENREPADESNFTFILDTVTELDSAIAAIRFNEPDIDTEFEGMVDMTFENLQVLQPAGEEPVQAEEDDFEIDDEMLEIFRMEADDLLKNITQNLENLGADPTDSNSLWEIRRNAHTFKGAAGIIGLKRPSQLAHRLEDLLDTMAEKKAACTPDVYELMMTTNDCLHEMIGGTVSELFDEKVDKIYNDFDLALAAVNSPTSSEQPATAEDPKPLHQTTSLETELLPSDEQISEIPGKTNGKGSVIRVSLDRLDDLSKHVRDLVVSRSVFEQRLMELEMQILELQNSTRRLRSSSDRIETEFEAFTLGDNRAGIANSEFDSLEFDRYTDFHQTARELTETASDTFAINSSLEQLKNDLETLYENQVRSVDQIQEKLLHIRMVEFSSLAPRLQRIVRMTAEEERKNAEVIVEDDGSEIDTEMMGALIEPLQHLLKNSVVHGIESPDTRRLLNKPEKGLIKVRIETKESFVQVTVSDDGRGISVNDLKEKALMLGLATPEEVESADENDLFELIFVPGLTTADRLSLSAGRGVGMSIVRESVEARHGKISISSQPGFGTTFTINIPLSLTIANVLLVRSVSNLFAIPANLVNHVIEVETKNAVESDGKVLVDVSGKQFEYSNLSEYLGFPTAGDNLPESSPCLLIENGDKAIALAISQVVKSEEVVVNSLGWPLRELKGVAGAAVLGNGSAVPVLDLPALLALKQNGVLVNQKTPTVYDDSLTVMIVDDSPSVRHMTSKVIGNAGWTFVTAKDGVEALEILRSGENRPNIILSDVEMPRMNGYEFVSALKYSDEFSDIPVIMITSRAAAKHRTKAEEIGVDQYITKPFDDLELIGSIKKLTSQAVSVKD